MMAVSLSPAGVAVLRLLCCPHAGISSSSVRIAAGSSSSGRLSLGSIFYVPKESNRRRLRSRAVTELAEATSAGLRTEQDARASAELLLSDVETNHSTTFIGVTSEEGIQWAAECYLDCFGTVASRIPCFVVPTGTEAIQNDMIPISDKVCEWDRALFCRS